MTYQQRLAFHLRARGYGEGEIAEIIREVLSHGTSEPDIVREFGTPDEYAEKFPKQKGPRTRGVKVIIIAIALGFAWIIFAFVSAAIFHFDVREIAGLGVVWPAAAVMAVGLAAGFLVDSLRPAPTLKPVDS